MSLTIRKTYRYLTAPSVDEHPSGRVAPWKHAGYALATLGLFASASVALYTVSEATRIGSAVAGTVIYLSVLWLTGFVVSSWAYAGRDARDKRTLSVRLAKSAADLAEHEAWRAGLDTRTCLDGVLARQAEEDARYTTIDTTTSELARQAEERHAQWAEIDRQFTEKRALWARQDAALELLRQDGAA